MSDSDNSDKHIGIIKYIIDIKKNIGNIKPMNVSDIGKDMLFIPLETTGDAMIREIKKVCIHNSYIFVCADNRILVFKNSFNLAFNPAQVLPKHPILS